MTPDDAMLLSYYLQRVTPRGNVEENEVIRLLSLLNGLQKRPKKEHQIERVK